MSHLPSHWGPLWWPHIHSVGMTFKESRTEDEEIYASYFRGLPATLPCPGCRLHCIEYLTSHPPPVSGNAGTDALWKWTVDFHNAVNSRKEKREFSYEEAEKHWKESFNNREMAVDSFRHDYVRKADSEAKLKAERETEIYRSHATALDSVIVYLVALLSAFTLIMFVTVIM